MYKETATGAVYLLPKIGIIIPLKHNHFLIHRIQGNLLHQEDSANQLQITDDHKQYRRKLFQAL